MITLNGKPRKEKTFKKFIEKPRKDKQTKILGDLLQTRRCLREIIRCFYKKHIHKKDEAENRLKLRSIQEISAE